MKKITLLLALAACLSACKKDVVKPSASAPDGDPDNSTVEIRFTPYQVSPMKQNPVSTICSKLDVYIVDVSTGDTLRFHQDKNSMGANFGSITTTLQTNKTYHLYAMGHNTTDTCTFSNGIFSFPDNKIKATVYADTTFSPSDGLLLSVEMHHIVGMFKMRVADQMPGDVTKFTFEINSAGCKWDAAQMQSADRGIRLHTINGTSQGSDGYVTYNVYVMGDNMEDVLYVDITATARTASDQAVETRHFNQVPIRDGYVTTYTGTFFVTFDMAFSFLVSEWSNGDSFTY